MHKRIHIFLRPRLGAVLPWLCCGMATLTQLNAQPYPPAVGAGIVATLQADQTVYTNQPDWLWCPPCVTNSPPCKLACSLIAEKTAIARFSFEVSNQYRWPRTFVFSSGQQFDIELIDETGQVVAAWSDGQFFTQSLTSFTLDSGATAAFTGELVLKDRDGRQLNGTYLVRAFLTTSGSYPRVETTGQIAVTLMPNG